MRKADGREGWSGVERGKTLWRSRGGGRAQSWGEFGADEGRTMGQVVRPDEESVVTIDHSGQFGPDGLIVSI